MKAGKLRHIAEIGMPAVAHPFECNRHDCGDLYARSLKAIEGRLIIDRLSRTNSVADNSGPSLSQRGGEVGYAPGNK
jgi:hypothetical protein